MQETERVEEQVWEIVDDRATGAVVPAGDREAGHRGGRPKVTAEARQTLEAIRSLSAEVPERMKKLLDGEKVPPAVKVRVMEIILERTFGKPEASVHLTAGLERQEGARARLEAIAARIRLEMEEGGKA